MMSESDRLAKHPAGDRSTDGRLDGRDLAILTHRIDGIVRKMMNTLFRAGRSTVLTTGRDFSCCILTRDGDLLAAAESLPIHVMGGPELAAKGLADFHPSVRPGDAFLHNSPYHGNSHAADHSIIVPVIDDDGLTRFLVYVKAHQADCGNSLPTTYMTGARDVYQEGALLFPYVRVQEGYQDCIDIIRMCELRIRVPDQWKGDYLALIGAARIGEANLRSLGREKGWNFLEQYYHEWFEYSEGQMMRVIRSLPSRLVCETTTHDPFPGTPDTGLRLRAEIAVDPRSAFIDVNLEDNPDSVPSGLNLTEATARAATMTGIFNALHADVPANAGAFRRVRIQLRSGCVVGIPVHPVSCSVATTNLADRLTNVVQRALVKMGTGLGLAEAGLMAPPSQAVISGFDPRRTDSPFMNELTLFSGGGPASPFADGWLTFLAPNAAGLAMLDSVEIDEQRYPIRIFEQRLIRDTAGAGRFRGGPGVFVEYGPVGSTIEVMYQSDGNVNPPLGANGGSPGAPARQYRRDTDGVLSKLGAYERVVLRPGESVVSMSCGGGGYGCPLDREADAVWRDVAEGWISPECAMTVYGVVATAAGIDRRETGRLRAMRRQGVRGETEREDKRSKT